MLIFIAWNNKLQLWYQLQSKYKFKKGKLITSNILLMLAIHHGYDTKIACNESYQLLSTLINIFLVKLWSFFRRCSFFKPTPPRRLIIHAPEQKKKKDGEHVAMLEMLNRFAETNIVIMINSRSMLIIVTWLITVYNLINVILIYIYIQRYVIYTSFIFESGISH